MLVGPILSVWEMKFQKETMCRIIQDDLHLHAYHVTTQPNVKG